MRRMPRVWRCSLETAEMRREPRTSSDVPREGAACPHVDTPRNTKCARDGARGDHNTPQVRCAPRTRRQGRAAVLDYRRVRQEQSPLVRIPPAKHNVQLVEDNISLVRFPTVKIPLVKINRRGKAAICVPRPRVAVGCKRGDGAGNAASPTTNRSI